MQQKLIQVPPTPTPLPGINGAISCPLARKKVTFVFHSLCKSFTVEASSVKMAEYWPGSFLMFFLGCIQNIAPWSICTPSWTTPLDNPYFFMMSLTRRSKQTFFKLMKLWSVFIIRDMDSLCIYYTFLGNCPPTPPLSQTIALSEKQVLMLA